MPKIQLSGLMALLFCGLMGATFILSIVFQPDQYLAKTQNPIRLDADIPSRFGEWQVDPDITPVLPDPVVLQKLASIYSQVLAKTYIDKAGRHVMLSIAYGQDQRDDSSQVHRPEFCYAAQGFALQRLPESLLAIGQGQLLMHRLTADRISRHENIAYWVVMSGKQISPGWQRKWAQVQYGLQGKIPDGVLMRVSTVDVENDNEANQILASFTAQLYQAIATDKRVRYFGI